MRILSVIAASLALSVVAGQALAHCRDARKTCEFTAQCAKSNGARAEKIRDGARKNNAAGGNAIWTELAGCALGGLAWSPRGSSGENLRSYDDIASGCTPADYLATGKAGVQLLDGNEGACNQFPE